MTDELSPSSYVELQPEYEAVYQRARAGSRGWIRDRRTDDYGFDEAFIEWDKDHFLYNGEPDGWTFANHFISIEEQPDAPQRVSLEEQIERYVEEITEAFDRAAESDAFFLITMRRGYVMDVEVVAFDTFLGAADDDLRHIPREDILRFVGEQMKKRRDD